MFVSPNYCAHHFCWNSVLLEQYVAFLTHEQHKQWILIDYANSVVQMNSQAEAEAENACAVINHNRSCNTCIVPALEWDCTFWGRQHVCGFLVYKSISTFTHIPIDLWKIYSPGRNGSNSVILSNMVIFFRASLAAEHYGQYVCGVCISSRQQK